MATWKALIPPRLKTQDQAGRCLPYAQSFFGAPIRYDYAFQAWEATQHKHSRDEALPDVPVLLWFSHYGTYYSHSKGVWEYTNAGHVTIHVPGDAIYTSPTNGYGSQRFATIGEIERNFNATYVGWSEDINGLRVAEPGEEDDMFTEEDRALLRHTAHKANASYDALFTRAKTTQGYHAGVLPMTNAIYDAQFKKEETSLGTPGGTLVNDRLTLAKLDAIIKHFEIEVPDASE